MSTNTLLIVDDEESILKSLQRLFRKQPFRTLTATSPAQALEVFVSNEVSVVLSDQRMPGMMGSEFLKTIRATHPETIRIIMSGYTELDSITSAINDGAVFKFLTKPWHDDQLIEHIHEAFEIYNLRRNNHRLTEALRDANHRLNARCQDLQSLSGIQQDMLALTQSIMEHVPSEILCVDDDGRIVLANPAAHRRFATSGLMDRSALDVLPEPLRAGLHTLLGPAVADARGPLAVTLPAGPAFLLSRIAHPGGAGGIVLARQLDAPEATP